MSKLKVIPFIPKTNENIDFVDNVLKQSQEWASENNATEAIVILRNADGDIHIRDCVDDIYRAIGILEMWKAETLQGVINVEVE